MNKFPYYAIAAIVLFSVVLVAIPNVRADSTVTFTSTQDFDNGTKSIVALQNSNIMGGAWTWFQEPRAIHYTGTQNKTYFGGVDDPSGGQIKIASYNHTSESFSTFVLNTLAPADDHNNPAIYIRTDGRIVAYYTQHSDPTMRWRKSTNTEDISAFGVEQTFVESGAVDYPNPFRMSNEANKVYMFYRSQCFSPTRTCHSMRNSTDDGDTFGSSTVFIDDAGSYLKYASNGTRVHIAMTNGHPTNAPNVILTYMYYENGAFYHANGTLIKTVSQLPILPSEGTFVASYTEGNGDIWLWDIYFDSNGNPIILFPAFPISSDHRYRYARWDGTQFVHFQIVAGGNTIDDPGNENEPHYSAGMSLDKNDVNRVYLGRQHFNTIESWITTNGGQTWSLEETVFNGNSSGVEDSARPIVPIDHTEDFRVLWFAGDYGSYTIYDTDIYVCCVNVATDGNNGVETNTDNPAVPGGGFQLAGMSGDRFNILDTDADTFKWNLVNQTITGCPTSSDIRREISSGQLKIERLSGPSATCFIGVIGAGTYTGNFDVTAQFTISSATTGRQWEMELYNEAARCTGTGDGVLFRQFESSIQTFKCENGAFTQIGTSTAVTGTTFWFRIDRISNVYTSYRSTDGSNWVQDESFSDADVTGAMYTMFLGCSCGGTTDLFSLFIDDYRVSPGTFGEGTFRTSASWTSPVVSSLGFPDVLNRVNISFFSVTPIYAVDFVSILSPSGDVLENFTNDITSGTSAVIIPSGSHSSVKIRIGLKGDGTVGTPHINEVTLQFGSPPPFITLSQITDIAWVVVFVFLVTLAMIGAWKIKVYRGGGT